MKENNYLVNIVKDYIIKPFAEVLFPQYEEKTHLENYLSNLENLLKYEERKWKK
jgi:hypothetical protein